ncbi:MAG: TonB-dependent receptor [Capnocytophaga sp.]|nr:TonB-dependent receptor [Capnocytophaga sp.]
MSKHFFLSILFGLAMTCVIFAQEKTISGTVTDSNGEPLSGVSVVIKGTTQGTSTDFDGNFNLRVNPSDVLVFSYIGFITQEKPVGGGNYLTVNLLDDLQQLDDVIVVGYTTQKKSNVTSSVATVENKKLTTVTSPDVSTLLQGQASGIQVVQGSGQPGTVSDIRIRGIASTGGNVSPLWVVDGVIMHGTPNISPNEIESISVLKDASATALYGSRAANGVVQVVTKSGARGKTSLTIATRTGFSDFSMGKFKLMDSQQLYDYYQLFGNPASIPSGITQGVTATDYNWLKNGTQTGITQDHSISLTGGTEKSRTFMSVGYFKEEGTVKGYTYDRVNFRLNHDYSVNDRLTLKPKLTANYNKRNSQQHSLYDMYNNMPWDNPYDADGQLINPKAAGYSGTWYGRDERNYLYDLQWNYSKGRQFNLLGNFDLEYAILPKLKFISTNSVSLYYSDSFSYTDPRSVSGLATQGQLYKFNDKRYTNFTNQMLRYSDVFGNHSLNALVAYEYNNYKYESNSATGQGIVSGSKILDNATKPVSVGGLTNDYALQSVLFNADYAYSQRYLAQFSIRRDGASNFGLENQYGTFYSGSLGWNIHNESFFQSNFINELKIRASYGGLGNRPSSLYPQYELYGLGYSYDGSPAIAPDQLGNPDLSWEKSYQTNFGLDALLFNQLSLTFEYYIKDTSDLLYYVTLPATSGFTGYWENIGGVKNTGFEMNFLWNAISQPDGFGLSLGGNIGVNRNEITEVYQGRRVVRGLKVTEIGEDFNSWYMPKWMGVDPDNGNPLWEVVDATTGDRTTTTNYNNATQQIVGTSSPDFYGGFFLSASYKQFSLSSNFNFSKGGQIYNYSRELYDSDGAYPTYNQMQLADGWSRWENPGDQATHPRPMYNGNNLSNKTSSRYLEDASFLRLRNVRLAYNLPVSVLEKLKIGQLEVYVSGDNLLTFTKYSGLDPEGGIDGAPSSQYPIAKRYAVGLNITF